MLKGLIFTAAAAACLALVVAVNLDVENASLISEPQSRYASPEEQCESERQLAVMMNRPEPECVQAARNAAR